MFCNVEKDAVITAKDVETIYEVPIVFRKEGLDELIVRQLRLQTGPPNLREWDAMVQKIKHPKHEIAVALVGKYAGLKECYKSLAEALVHGGIDHETRVNINWIESEDIERQGTERILRKRTAFSSPGFGARGIEGKITTIRFARSAGAVPRPVPRHAVRHDRIRTQRRRLGRCQQRRVRRTVTPSGHSLDARTAGH
jgi:CTP synthase